jgi:hypothetical protein
MLARDDPLICSRRLGQVALVAPAALLVHELRFVLAFGGGAGAELQRTGHSYLQSLVPWLVLLLALAAARYLTRSLRGGRTRSRSCMCIARTCAR